MTLNCSGETPLQRPIVPRGELAEMSRATASVESLPCFFVLGKLPRSPYIAESRIKVAIECMIISKPVPLLEKSLRQIVPFLN